MRKKLGVICALAACAIGVTSATAANAATLRTGGSTGMQLLATAMANSWNQAQAKKAGFNVTVTGGGSGAGIRGAANGTFDVGNSSRDKGSSDAAATVFTAAAREPFVIIVNPKNTVKKLTKAQVKDILIGNISNWKQVGGADAPIVRYGRTDVSGTFASCKKLFTDGQQWASGYFPAPSAGIDRAKVARDRNGVSCVTLAYLLTAKGSLKIDGVTIDGVAPTLRNAASGKYPYLNNQYFVTNGNPSGNAAAYIAWATSKATQCSITIKYALPIAGVTC
ncbi:MAG: substrate-binding domain-containing protein [Thermoleophilia bacterium]